MGDLPQTGTSRLRSLALNAASKVAAIEAAPRPVVLVVDDDADVRDSLATVLESKYRVRACPSGDEALRIADSETEAVVLDIRMPHRDGFWTYQSLRAKLPLVPIIFYSAYQDEKDPFEVMNDYKPFAYITKGSHLAKLEAKEAAVLAEEFTSAERRGFAIERELIVGAHVTAFEPDVYAICKNLVVNARDALAGAADGRQQTLKVAVLKRDGQPVLRVEDNGIGISPEQKAHIFEPFFTTKGGQGTGLGLATVKKLVELYEGTIEWESQPGVGTQFVVIWPE